MNPMASYDALRRDSASFSRRSWLRGVGVTMALPWMESLSVWGSQDGSAKTPEAPVRLAILFAGNGFHGSEWWAKEDQGKLQLGRVLAPLQDFSDSVLYQRALQCGGFEGQHPQFPNRQPIVGGTLDCRRRDSIRYQRRPDASANGWTADQSPEFGVGL
jgi:hypothetical protein